MRIFSGWSALRAMGMGIAFVLLAGSAQAALVGLREVGTGASSVDVPLGGGSLNLELFLDTEGLSFEGYYLGVDFSLGPLTIQSVTNQPLAGLFPDLFGVSLIDNGALTIRDMNQITFSTGLPAGVYVLDLIELEIGARSGGQITATPGLFGEVLGLAGGACPGTVPGCSVSYQSVQITPEPTTALLLACGLLGLGLHGKGRRH